MATLGVYIQIPFCSSKCSFCNFSSKVAPAKTLEDYLGNLEREIDLLPRALGSLNDGAAGKRVSSSFLALPVNSVYLGGGTPTLAGADGLNRIFAALRRQFLFASVPEVTLEMTPGSADAGLLTVCRQQGINRLSVGAQSFDDRELRTVGRLHSGIETVEQVRLARAAGFENISIDLIAGLPYQNEASWLRSLRNTLDLAPEHISVYLFEVDEKSRLGNEVLRHGERFHASEVPDEDFMADAYERAQEMFSDAGYVQYEISNFARPGFESRHNQKYWRLDPYLGIGAGAHSFDGHSRWANVASTDHYAAMLAREELPIEEWRTLEPNEQIEEFFFLGLRQQEGIDIERALKRFGVSSLEAWQPRVASLLHKGLLETDGGRVRLAPHAYLISNEVFQEFLD
ncbi:MAG TPA: radical SAM family heme chaperone HemW [Terriglobia bacterium]|nr:radical SAM family heme chaperone HemW [Terriglobia bacterium]